MICADTLLDSITSVLLPTKTVSSWYCTQLLYETSKRDTGAIVVVQLYIHAFVPSLFVQASGSVETNAQHIEKQLQQE